MVAGGENISLLPLRAQAAAKGPCCGWGKGEISPPSVCLPICRVTLVSHTGAERQRKVCWLGKERQNAGGWGKCSQTPRSQFHIPSCKDSWLCCAEQGETGGKRGRGFSPHPRGSAVQSQAGSHPNPQGEAWAQNVISPSPTDATIAHVGHKRVSHGRALVPPQGVGPQGWGRARRGLCPGLGLGSPTGLFPP